MREDGVTARFFVYRDSTFDITLQGIDGEFIGQSKEMAEFIQYPEEGDLSPIKQAIIEKHPLMEFGEFYTVTAEIVYIGGEYGDYGVCIHPAYYCVGKVLDVTHHEDLHPQDAIAPTESA